MSQSSDYPSDFSESAGASLTNFGTSRSQKRLLLAEQESGWAAGDPLSPEELLKRWPVNPDDDDDVASVLFADLIQRRTRGEDSNLADYSQRFPRHRDSLADLISRKEFLRSLDGESAAERCNLCFPEVGDELFGFRFRAELGRGAFARVFLAEQTELACRPVAVKVSAIEGAEPQALAQMQHTHIVPIYSLQDDLRCGLRAVCMPYFGGATLSCVLVELGSKTALPMQGRELVEALERCADAAALPRAKEKNTPVASSI
ncbi:MAG: hypothetical protein WCL32_26380, partial [Planctomycetota bacterium]